MTREQKLEAALREVRSYISSSSYGEIMRSIIDTAVATPPTSEWNDAIEAAAELCDGRAVDCDFESDTSIDLVMPDQSGIMRQLAEDIRALKREEQP